MTTYVPPFAPQGFRDRQPPNVSASWLNAIDNILQGQIPAVGPYTPTFVYGQIQLAGPNGYMTSFGDFGFGLQVPGPGGTGPSLLLGGATKSFAQIITDEQVPGQKGINLYIAAGESATGDVNGGGDLWLFGGASDAGPGGQMKIQGGTSVNNTAGDVQILGGNSSTGPAGNVYIIAGQAGSAGGSVKLYATSFNGAGGDISFWLGQLNDPHSVPLFTMSHTGAFFPGNQGAGNAGDFFQSGGNLAPPVWGPAGIKKLAPLTLSGGTATQPIGNFFYIIIGNLVVLWTEDALTSTPTGPDNLILSTLPSAIRPSNDRKIPCTGLFAANLNIFSGMAIVSPDGGVRIAITSIANNYPVNQDNSFPLSGLKGLSSGWWIAYTL